MPGAHHSTQDQQVVQNKQSFTISSASLSSSFCSSGASSMLLPAAPPSSHSDISTSDQFASVSTTTFKSISGAPTTCPSPALSPSTSSMGQVVSRPQLTTASPPSSTLPSLGHSSSSASSRLKRAFVGRRKKSDVTPSSASSPKIGTGREPHNVDDSIYGTMNSAPARQLSAKQLTRQLTSHVFSKKHSGSVPASPALSGLSLPPPLPPKQTPAYSTSRLTPVNTNVDKRLSVMTTSSPIAPALDYMRRSDDHRHTDHVAKENERRDLEKSESKEIRRKSDSTLSHHTIRPGRRTPRPVSLAESLHSTHTVVPANKRLSALITDAEYIMPEEEDGDRNEDKTLLAWSTSLGRRTSPASSLKVRDRRSQSLNLGPPLSLMASAPTAAQASMSMDAIRSTVPRSVSEEHDRPVATREMGATAFSSLPSDSSRPTGVASRANLNAALRSGSSPPSTARALADPPQASRRTPLVPHHGPTPPSFRQTAISMTSGFAPAAGLARRAVEKMGRVWSSKTSSPSPLSSPVGSVPSSFSNGRVGPLARASSNHSDSTQHHGKKGRHTPHTPSVSSTGSSLSDHEGPKLGKRLRAPIRVTATGAGVAGGLVFGRDLRTCVKDTAIDSVRDMLRTHKSDESVADVSESNPRSEPSAALEGRYIPALVVRCAQHILAWGIQEQGLFRVSGRSSHIARLRVEFDTGADFDLVQSSPGDLDPHAVAAIFKAYLRELPEPILTNNLVPYFDAAMASERLTNNAHEATSTSPKDIHPGLRKPPSLSTLAMSSFATAHPPSESFRKALSSLISRLPQENRDLLLTVTEVINHTARRSQETKMPLSNLLLVLCPSLGMNPSLLQALCESEGIWDGIQPVREARVPDVLPPERSQDRDDTEGNSSSCSGAPETTASLRTSSSDSNRLARPLPDIPVENGVPLPALVTNSHDAHAEPPLSPSQSRSSQDASAHMVTDSSETSSSFTSTDDSSSASQLSQGGRPVTPTSVHFRLTNPYTPPSLSSSTESLSVPSLSSGSPMRSTKHLPFMDDCSEPQTSTSPHSPIIAEHIFLTTPPKLSHPTIQPQFHFPSTGEGAPKVSLPHRRSTPSLSIESSVSGDMRSNSLASRAKRLKKPSLHLLFAKRSASPVSSPGSQSPAFGVGTPLSAHPEGGSRLSSASESSPESMVTAPQSSRFSYPPVLNTAIDESSISLALGIEEDREDHTLSVAHTAKDTPMVAHGSLSPQTPVPHNPASRPSKASIEGAFRHLDIALPENDQYEGEWTQSVLLAAGEPRW